MVSKLDLEPTEEEIADFLVQEGYHPLEVWMILDNWDHDPEYVDIACIAEQKVKQKKMEAMQKTD